MMQSLVTVVVPFSHRATQVVRDVLATWRDEEQQVRSALDATRIVHFLSVVVFPPEDEEKGDSAHLVIEISADGPARGAIEALATALPERLRHVLALTGAASWCERKQLTECLWHYAVEPRLSLFGRPTGLGFQGTRDLSVRRIRLERLLAARLRELLDLEPAVSPALAKLENIRARIFQEPEFKWAFVSEPIDNIVGPQPQRPPGPTAWWVVIWLAVRDLLKWWPLLLPAATFLGVAYFSVEWWRWGDWWRAPWDLSDPRWLLASCELAWRTLSQLVEPADWAFRVFIGVALATAVVGGLGFWALLRAERADAPRDSEPTVAHMNRIMAHEDRPGWVQNHLAGQSFIKPGWFRRVAVQLALCLIRDGARQSRPGYIDKIGTIHFARWIWLKNSRKLIFLSNYDGSWQSYLEDFIARLREGLTSVWMHTRDFPRTEGIVQGGAEDGSRFKRWARRQQVPTNYWYSAYPELSAQRIRTNAAIRHGFACAGTEEEAARWLAYFGYPPQESLQIAEIPTLAFGGLSKLRFAHGLAIRFPDAQGRNRRVAQEWLASIEHEVSYGDRMPRLSALALALSYTGLCKLGLDEPALASFPVAFQQGMSARSRALGDRNGEIKWHDHTVDAVLLLYADTEELLAQRLDETRAELKAHGIEPARELRMETIPENGVITEPFGFRDGVSQPVIRGLSRKGRGEQRDNVIAAGELVLGYKDNLEFVPPTPSDCGRDIGRNGTYLVIRELEQKTEELKAYLADTAEKLIKAQPALLPSNDAVFIAKWLAAKMVGRWHNGSSLVRYPNAPGPDEMPPAMPDNSFLFGRDDRDGLRCPFGAHIRRANPRDSFEPESPKQMGITNRHRILRVGRRFPAPHQGANPGLFFMCVNADIERQFEFLQQTWINGTGFHDLDEEVDPLVGGGCPMTIPTLNGPIRLPALDRYVIPHGGGYFFMPGKSALRVLAHAWRPSPGERKQATPQAVAESTEAAVARKCKRPT